MWLHFFVFLCYYIIFCIRFVNVKAIIGQNVRPVREREYPFVVSIMRISKNPNPTMDHQCTGTLVTNRDVLTNAHCVTYEVLNHIQIIVGSISLSGGNKYYPLWWKTYNEWCDQKHIPLEFEINDVAIIRLSGNVTEEIDLPVLSTIPNSELYGLNVTISGWGISNTGCIPDILETVNLKVITNTECENTGFKLEGLMIPIHTRLLCTAANPFALMQFGDSGGPLLYTDKIIAVNGGTFPLPQQDVHPEKVNLHFSIEYYKNFIVDVINHC